MNQFVIVLTLLIASIFAATKEAHAGQYELSANGSYYKYDNGTLAGDASSTTISRVGAGISYSFLENTALEISYSDQKTTDVFSQISTDETMKWHFARTTRIKNVSLDLVIGFSGKGSRFKPYLRGGGGYTIRTATVSGDQTDLADDSETDIDVQATESKSVTAQAGTGFKYYLADRIALEFSYTIFGSELDKPKVYIHHAVAGGLRIVF